MDRSVVEKPRSTEGLDDLLSGLPAAVVNVVQDPWRARQPERALQQSGDIEASLRGIAEAMT
jgi:hypothetical protein